MVCVSLMQEVHSNVIPAIVPNAGSPLKLEHTSTKLCKADSPNVRLALALSMQSEGISVNRMLLPRRVRV
jgi:hypothetical protein